MPLAARRAVELRFPRWRDERDYFQTEGRRLKATLRALLCECAGGGAARR